MSGIEVTIRNLRTSWVAFAPRTGPYAGIPLAVSQMMEWMDANEYPQAGPLGGAYFNSPMAVPPEALQWEVRCPVPPFSSEGFNDEQAVGVKQLAERQLAVTVHQRPLGEIGATYQALGEWVTANGYRVSGPAEEVWILDALAEEQPVEVCFPVEKG